MKDFLAEKIEELAFRRIVENETLVSSKLLDSITLVDLAVAIEEEAGIEIPFNEINEENFDTIILLEKYILSKKSE